LLSYKLEKKLVSEYFFYILTLILSASENIKSKLEQWSNFKKNQTQQFFHKNTTYSDLEHLAQQTFEAQIHNFVVVNIVFKRKIVPAQWFWVNLKKSDDRLDYRQVYQSWQTIMSLLDVFCKIISLIANNFLYFLKSHNLNIHAWTKILILPLGLKKYNNFSLKMLFKFTSTLTHWSFFIDFFPKTKKN